MKALTARCGDADRSGTDDSRVSVVCTTCSGFCAALARAYHTRTRHRVVSKSDPSSKRLWAAGLAGSILRVSMAQGRAQDTRARTPATQTHLIGRASAFGGRLNNAVGAMLGHLHRESAAALERKGEGGSGQGDIVPPVRVWWQWDDPRGRCARCCLCARIGKAALLPAAGESGTTWAQRQHAAHRGRPQKRASGRAGDRLHSLDAHEQFILNTQDLT